ncbi:hypothetical protein ACSC9U_17425 [Pseudomonas solani]|uniref:hypothetical protein n=1 Tax=Pseudomonas solani TaxID=2731552 RepID=UPI003F4AC1DD
MPDFFATAVVLLEQRGVVDEADPERQQGWLSAAEAGLEQEQQGGYGWKASTDGDFKVSMWGLGAETGRVNG